MIYVVIDRYEYVIMATMDKSKAIAELLKDDFSSLQVWDDNRDELIESVTAEEIRNGKALK